MADRLRYQLPAGITSALRWAFAVIGVASMVFGYIGIRAYLLRGDTDSHTDRTSNPGGATARTRS